MKAELVLTQSISSDLVATSIYSKIVVQILDSTPNYMNLKTSQLMREISGREGRVKRYDGIGTSYLPGT